MEITAAVSRTTGEPMSIEKVLLEEPRDNEVLVRVVATGICHTDVAMRDASGRVPKPIVLGHEGAGIVERTGKAVRKVKPGDHVVMSFDSCGQCPSCYRGDAAYCLENNRYNFAGQRKDGSTALTAGGTRLHSHFFGQSAFATYSICTERNVVPVRKDISLELLGPLGCGIQTGAGAVINSLKAHAGSSIGIFGTGSVGLAAVMAAKLAGAATIIAVDTQQQRLDLALELGATHAVNAAREETFAQVKAICPIGMDFAVDTSGNLAVIKQAVEHLAPRGVCGLINSAKGADASLNILNMMLGARSVRGIHQGDSVPELFIPQMIELYAQGRFPFDKLVTFYELENINQAMADMEAGKAIKPIIRMPPAR
ncbi:NAD(P)-dependent alcohol dehydrogenase [Lacisediminimonas profundi]|uniref:NAD(P)-dependent alcohol dehydrogenase n=1 Tax=Lacisediminimonas profundi TaxID=2603856 RepID=UPI00124BB2CD|nr:NAD(P)-dependent alcohol dehydrogenase [Lacisediminimonas profundi]